MPKKPVSLTLEETNLLWLKGRARVLAGGSLSEAVDRLIGDARAGRIGMPDAPRSVVGTIDVPDEMELVKADAEIRGLFAGSLARAAVLHEGRPRFQAARAGTKRKK